MEKSGNYNREETWGEMYKKHGEEKTGQSDFRSFAEQFAERGMQGFNRKEKEEEFRATRSSGKRQRYPDSPQAQLDLHGLTLEEAKPMVEKFVRESRELGMILVSVIPGIGRNSENGRSKLRPMVVEKLGEMVQNQVVVDFKTAEPKHGGFGAIYVYLK